LGCKAEQDLKNGTVRMSQEKRCNDLLKHFQKSDINPVSTPCESILHLQASRNLTLSERDPQVVCDYERAFGSF